MIVDGTIYRVTINDLYIDDERFRLVLKGEIYNKNKKEKHNFEEYIILDEYDKSDIRDKVDVYDN